MVGSALRIVGLTWGLPAELHTDEPFIVNGAVDLAHRHSLEPKYFMRPDHVEIQLSNAAYQIYSHLAIFTEFTTVAGRPAPRDPDVRFLVLSGCMSQRYYADPKYVRSRAFYRAARKDFTLLESYPAGELAAPSGIEPIDIFRSAKAPIAYLEGKRAGCDIEVYAVD